MPRLDFVPERDGFHFDNSFGNQILPGIPFTFTTYGLCGGMVMAALDHQEFAYDFDPGVVVLSIVCPGYPPRQAQLRVRPDVGRNR